MAPTNRILVVEDDRGIRELLADRLRQFDLAFATCQSEAYEQLQSADFDLVLLDLRLPRKPDDMKPTNQVGIDILGEIRKRRLVKRGSAMLMPVVVMTAYGSEKLSAQVLVENGANDYIPKPFGTDRTLEHKIEVALAGEGALVPAANIVGSVVRLSFHPEGTLVRIEALSYRGAHCGLLRALGDLFLKDWQALRAPEKFDGIRGEVLADQLGISGQAARARIVKFRQDVKRDFRERIGRAIGDNDIVENLRDWQGYRLNPLVVRILGWDQMPDIDP
ncbi:MAG: response regulator [Deltaproteobacteria bacterium]|nr:response regulator [Deltaproteobacteria bacterium]